MVLCGVLHVTYQSPERLTGAYMVCVLFDHYFLLAKQVDDSRRLEAVACMYVWDLKIDSLRNGKGETYHLAMGLDQYSGCDRDLLLRMSVFVEIGIPPLRWPVRTSPERFNWN